MMGINAASFTQPVYPVLTLEAVSMLALAIIDLMLIRKTCPGFAAVSRPQKYRYGKNSSRIQPNQITIYYDLFIPRLTMSIESIRISTVMTRNVKSETEDQNIQAVCKTMNENNIGSLIILTPPYDDNPKPVGIITERDVVRIIGQLYPSLQHAPIRELMSKPLITLSSNSSIKDAMQTMQQNNIRRIPIVEEGTIQGIVTDKDIFRAIMDNRIPLDNLVSGAAVAEGHRLVFDQCRDYFFNDIMRRG